MTVVEAVILALDPSKKASGAALFRPQGARAALVAYETVSTQAQRETFVRGACELADKLGLPLVVVAEEWDKPKHQPGINKKGQKTLFDQKWTFKTILGMGEGWGRWTAEFERYGVKSVHRATPNVWRDGLFGRKRPQRSEKLKEMAVDHVRGTFQLQLKDHEHDAAEAICIGLWGGRCPDVVALAAKERRRRIKRPPVVSH